MKDNCSNKSLVYNIIKALAVLSVLLFHTVNVNGDYGAFEPLVVSSGLGKLAAALHLVNMPLFMAASGCVFGRCLELGKYKKNSELIGKKAKRLLLPNFFFGICLVAPVMVFCGMTELDYGQYVVRGILLSADSRHLWYLSALFWIFCLGALLKPLCFAERPWYLLISALLFAAAAACSLPNFLQLANALHFQLYFFIGVFINNYYDRLLYGLRKLRVLLLPACPLLLAAAAPFGGHWGVALAAALLGIAYLLTLADWLAAKYPDIIENPFYRLLNRNGFGIYLFHPAIIYLLYYQLTPYPINPYVLALVVFSTALTGSILLTEILRRLHLGVVMGEKCRPFVHLAEYQKM